MEERIRRLDLRNKVMSAEEAATFIHNGDTVATSGFTQSAHPKAVLAALAQGAAAKGDDFKINLYTGASVGEEVDGVLAANGLVGRRMPYQTNTAMRKAINVGEVDFLDIHVGRFPLEIASGFVPKPDVAVVEVCAITEKGGLVPTTAVGIAPTAVRMADRVIVEVNLAQSIDFWGMADIYMPNQPPRRGSLPIHHAGQRIGSDAMPCDPRKIVAVVITEQGDPLRPSVPVDDVAKSIAGHLLDFLDHEVRRGHLPKNLLPLQSGVGAVGNAVLAGVKDSAYTNLEFYTEMMHDAVLDLIDEGRVKAASATAVSPTGEGMKKFVERAAFYREKVILRPQEISNDSGVIRRLGVIAMNTALEVDIYGHVNSTHVLGSSMMNGIGGSGDYARNAYLSIFTTPSVAKDGAISAIVPMVTHVDNPDHDVACIVTEQGFADLRGLSPKERAVTVIENCAHPDYRPALRDYFERAKKAAPQQTPHILEEAFSWHIRYRDTGSMR